MNPPSFLTRWYLPIGWATVALGWSTVWLGDIWQLVVVFAILALMIILLIKSDLYPDAPREFRTWTMGEQTLFGAVVATFICGFLGRYYFHWISDTFPLVMTALIFPNLMSQRPVQADAKE